MKEEFKIKNRTRSFRYAFNGIILLLKHEPNARIHLTITLAIIILGLLINLHTVQWCLVALAVGLVLMAEAMNSAIEKLVDHISPEKKEWAGQIKDLSAAGVLLAALAAATVGLIIFIPKLISLI
jgi:diacylglycerol kinase